MNQAFEAQILTGWQGHCPTCGRHAQAYRRRLHMSVCIQLMTLYKLGGHSEYIHISRLIPKGTGGSGDFTKAKYWNLIVEQPTEKGEKSNGGWMLTPLGVDYVLNAAAIQEWAVVYDDTVLRYEGKAVMISEAVKKKFDYDELMQGIL